MSRVPGLALWPAIDVRGGRIVRLLFGDAGTETVYEGEPAEAARRFEAEGADGLHVVDLDGAFDTGENRSTVLEIVRSVSIPVQVGGGLRSGEAIETVLGQGAARVVLGTLPFTDPSFFAPLLSRFGPRLVVALDCRDGRPTVRGWKQDAGAGEAAAVAARLAVLGVGALLVTDVACDGAMTGPNLELLTAVRRSFPGEILASGGMRGADDLAPVDRALSGGGRGAIFGRALHSGATTVARLRAACDLLGASPAGRTS